MAEKDYTALGQAAAEGCRPEREIRGRAVTAPLRAAILQLRRQRAETDGAARWLLDNRYLAEREGLAALAELSNARHLRALKDGTVLQHCCDDLIEACDGDLTADALEQWLTGYQRVLPLTQAEHALLLFALKAALVRSLAAVYRADLPDDKAAGRRFTALRTLATLDLSPVLERTDVLDLRLRKDPAGVYPKMDRASRAHYRETLARQARRRGVSETDWADQLLKRANQSPGETRHIGFALAAEEKAPPSGRAYWLAVALLTVLIAAALGLWTHSFSCAALPFPYVAAMGLEAPKAVTADGVIILNSLADVLSAAANSLFSILPEANKHYAEQIKMITDLRIGYEFFDIPEEGNDDYAPHNDLEKTLFKGSDKDGLKLHIAAIVSEDGLNRQSLEGDCILHKTINEDFMNAYLTGSWSDSNKNYWSFGYSEKDGVPYYQYSVITSTGSLLVSDPGYSPWVHYAGDTVFGSLETNFEGANTIYKIIDLNADTMSLRDDVGEIIMTREWSLF